MNDLLFNINTPSFPDIEGLSYTDGFISDEEESRLIQIIDQQPWSYDLKRRVQHYGYKYDYKARSVTPESYLGDLPQFFTPVLQRLLENKLLNEKPDQIIINDYLPGQGISSHIDCVPCFSEKIISLSLGSGAIMQFKHPQNNITEGLYLKRRSVVVLSGEARYDWQHSIPARKSDTVNGIKFIRSRRISLTFRNVILN